MKMDLINKVRLKKYLKNKFLKKLRYLSVQVISSFLKKGEFLWPPQSL